MSDVWVVTENDGTGDETVVRGVYGSLELAKAAGEALIVANRQYWAELATDDVTPRRHPTWPLDPATDPIEWGWFAIENDFRGAWGAHHVNRVHITAWPLQSVAS